MTLDDVRFMSMAAAAQPTREIGRTKMSREYVEYYLVYVQMELDRSSPSLLEQCDELDERC